MTYVTFLSATFDVQTVTVEGSEIEITVHFISNSLAIGCFVVLQSDSGSPDEFRVLLRSGSDLTLTDMISVPPSTYTLYVYDLEEDGHVNREPAILLEDRRIFVNTECKLTDNHKGDEFMILFVRFVFFVLFVWSVYSVSCLSGLGCYMSCLSGLPFFPSYFLHR